MKEQIYKICTQLNDGQITVTEASEQLLDLFVVSGAERKLVCPHCKSGEENFTRNGNHVWCRKCDYEFNVG